MVAIGALALTAVAFFPIHADARGFRGGGGVRGFGGGGFSGGSFSRGGGWATGPRGGAAVRGPGGGAAVRGPGGTYVRGGGNTYNRNVTVNQGWGAWGGYGAGAVAAGVAAGVAVGSVAATLPPSYQTVVVSGQNYYYANGAYYQPCYQGAEVSYCVVANPNP